MIDENKIQEKITRKDLNKVFWRLQALQYSWNYERMQSLGFLYVLKPILKKIYKNSTKEEKVKAMKRHLEFFNTNPIVSGPIFGITAAMEEQGKNNLEEAISSVKVGLMGPLAGLGDSIFWLTWLPICMSIGASFASQGNPVGLILALAMFNLLTIPAKYYGIRLGYEKGASFLNEAKETGIIQRGTVMATILGLIIVGGLVPQMVIAKVPLILAVGKVKVVVQTILDGIMPNLIPLAITFGCYRMIRKNRSPVVILLLIIVLSILFCWIGLLG